MTTAVGVLTSPPCRQIDLGPLGKFCTNWPDKYTVELNGLVVVKELSFDRKDDGSVVVSGKLTVKDPRLAAVLPSLPEVTFSGTIPLRQDLVAAGRRLGEQPLLSQGLQAASSGLGADDTWLGRRSSKEMELATHPLITGPTHPV